MPAQNATAYDASLGQQSFEQLGPRLEGLDASRLARTNVDIEASIIAALAVARRVSEPALLARFQSLPAGEFDPTCLQTLGTAAWATWYALRQYSRESATSSEARLPASLVKQAAEVEQRMQQCAEYHLNDHPTAGPWLLALRPGTGHRDLASDLAGYADIHEQHADVLRHDRRHFREGDVALARELSARILQLLGDTLSPEARSWQERLARCWTLLLSTYAEVSAAGSWLERKSPDVSRLFPSLHAVGRAAQKGSTEPTPAPPAPPNG